MEIGDKVIIKPANEEKLYRVGVITDKQFGVDKFLYCGKYTEKDSYYGGFIFFDSTKVFKIKQLKNEPTN